MSPNFLPTDFSILASAVFDLRLESPRIGAFVLVKIGADFGRDREPGRDRQTDARHLGEVRAFAAEKRLHVAARRRLCRRRNSKRISRFTLLIVAAFRSVRFARRATGLIF